MRRNVDHALPAANCFGNQTFRTRSVRAIVLGTNQFALAGINAQPPTAATTSGKLKNMAKRRTIAPAPPKALAYSKPQSNYQRGTGVMIISGFSRAIFANAPIKKSASLAISQLLVEDGNENER